MEFLIGLHNTIAIIRQGASLHQSVMPAFDSIPFQPTTAIFTPCAKPILPKTHFLFDILPFSLKMHVYPATVNNLPLLRNHLFQWSRKWRDVKRKLPPQVAFPALFFFLGLAKEENRKKKEEREREREDRKSLQLLPQGYIMRHPWHSSTPAAGGRTREGKKSIPNFSSEFVWLRGYFFPWFSFRDSCWFNELSSFLWTQLIIIISSLNTKK